MTTVKKIAQKCAVALLVASMIIGISGCTSDSDSGSAKTTEKSTEKTEYGVGETAEQNDIQVTLTDVIKSKGDDMFAVPDDGNVYEICVFEIKNNSESDLSVSSVMCFEAYCDDVSLSQDIMGSSLPETEKYEQLDGDVASGKTMKGAIVYQVPKDWENLEVRVNLDVFSSDEITFVAKNNK